MATIRICVGQCGNQIGQILSEQLSNGEEGTKGYSSVAGDNLDRAILVDSEEKVIRNKGFTASRLNIRPSNIITGKRGRGNNWAYGYEDHHSELLVAKTMDCLQKEAERCELFSNVLMIHSLCGGTGSGLGSRILQEIRDVYPTQHILSCVVAPFSTGDTPLQHYNALLSITALQKFSDAIMLFKNDSVQSILSSFGNENISLSKMNQHIASTISGSILPTGTLTAKNGYSVGLELSEIVRVLCPQPTLKFLTACQSKQRQAGVIAMCTYLTGHIKKEGCSCKCNALSNLLIVRGKEADGCMEHLNTLESKIRKNLNAVNWNPFPVDIWIDQKKLTKFSNTTQAVLLSNYSSIVPFCVNTWNRAQEMYGSRAFLHWYSKYGIDEDYFNESFDTMKGIVESYQEAVHG